MSCQTELLAHISTVPTENVVPAGHKYQLNFEMNLTERNWTNFKKIAYVPAYSFENIEKKIRRGHARWRQPTV